MSNNNGLVTTAASGALVTAKLATITGATATGIASTTGGVGLTVATTTGAASVAIAPLVAVVAAPVAVGAFIWWLARD